MRYQIDRGHDGDGHLQEMPQCMGDIRVPHGRTQCANHICMLTRMDAQAGHLCKWVSFNSHRLVTVVTRYILHDIMDIQNIAVDIFALNPKSRALVHVVIGNVHRVQAKIRIEFRKVYGTDDCKRIKLFFFNPHVVKYILGLNGENL